MSKELENMTNEEPLQEVKNLKTVNQSLLSEKQYLQFQLDQIKRMLFGSKRECFVSNEHNDQLSLPFDTSQAEPEEKEPETEDISYSRRKKNRDNHPGRLSLPDHLPVEERVQKPNEDVTGMKCIGKEVTDQLELTPARLFVIRYVRYKYVKPEDEDLQTFKGVIAELPVFPIEKGIAGSGLLPQIMVDKYVDHLPIHRQVQRFARDGVRIPSNTINGWQDKVSQLIAPLNDRQVRLVTGQGYLQVDETPIKVQDKDVKGKCHQGYYWVYNSPIPNAVVFDYQRGCGRDGPKKMLTDFKGYLQSDGYHVYDWFGKKKQITLFKIPACMCPTIAVTLQTLHRSECVGGMLHEMDSFIDDSNVQKSNEVTSLKRMRDIFFNISRVKRTLIILSVVSIAVGLLTIIFSIIILPFAADITANQSCYLYVIGIAGTVLSLAFMIVMVLSSLIEKIFIVIKRK